MKKPSAKIRPGKRETWFTPEEQRELKSAMDGISQVVGLAGTESQTIPKIKKLANHLEWEELERKAADHSFKHMPPFEER